MNDFLRHLLRPAVVRRFTPWLVLGLGALLPLARVLPDPAGILPGSAAGDVYKHAWAYWHTLAQLAAGDWPRTSFLNAPDGGILLDVMLLPSLLLAPLTLLAGPVFSANTWVWLSLLAVGGATYALANRLTGSLAGSLAAGLVAQTSPFLLGHGLTSGVHERLAIWIFPLLILGLLEIREHGGWRWPLLLAFALGAVTLHCHTYGVYAAVLVVLAASALLWPFAGHQSLRRAVRLLPTCLGLAVVMAAVFVLARWFVSQPDFLAGVPQSRVDMAMGITTSYVEVATPSSLLNPFFVRHQAPKLMDDELHNLCYLGWVPLLAIIAGAVAAWRRRAWPVLIVLGIGGCFLLLSLGPLFLVGTISVENPFYFTMANLLPFWGGLPAPWQHAGVAASLAVVGLAQIVAILPSRRIGPLVAAVLVLATWGERALVLPIPLLLNPASARPSPVYEAADGEGALVDIPRVWRDMDLTSGTMFMAQTYHHHPLPVAINLGMTVWDDYAPVKDGRASNWRAVATCLRGAGFRWIVLHQEWFATRTDGLLALEGLQRALGPPMSSHEQTHLFSLSRWADDTSMSGPDSPVCPSPSTPTITRPDAP